LLLPFVLALVEALPEPVDIAPSSVARFLLRTELSLLLLFVLAFVEALPAPVAIAPSSLARFRIELSLLLLLVLAFVDALPAPVAIAPSSLALLVMLEFSFADGALPLWVEFAVAV
jgi:hypothetical protein